MDFLSQRENFIEIKLKNDKFICHHFKSNDLESFTTLDEIIRFIYECDFDEIDLRLNTILRVLVCDEAAKIISKFGEIFLDHIKRMILVYTCAKTDNYLSENEKFQKYVDDLNSEILDINIQGLNYEDETKIEEYDLLANITENKNIVIGIVGFYENEKFISDIISFDLGLLNTQNLSNLNKIQKNEALKELDDDEIKKIAKQYLGDENEAENIKNSVVSFYETAGLKPIFTINSIGFGVLLNFYAKNSFEISIEKLLSRANSKI